MGVANIVDLINTFLAQCCMSIGKSGHKKVKGVVRRVLLLFMKPFNFIT